MTKITYKRNDQGKIVREVEPEITKISDLLHEGKTLEQIREEYFLEQIPEPAPDIKPSILTRIANSLKKLFDQHPN